MFRSKKYSAYIALIGTFAFSLISLHAQDYQPNDQPSFSQRGYSRLADIVRVQGKYVKDVLSSLCEVIPFEMVYIEHIAKSSNCRALLLAIAASLPLAYLTDISGPRVSIKKQIGCAVFLFCFACLQRTLMLWRTVRKKGKKPQELGFDFKDPCADFLLMCVTAPITEEIIYTYIPYALLGKYAKYVVPVRFGAMHYKSSSTKVQMSLALLNFNNHCALQAGYTYTPVLTHILNNFVLALLLYSRELNKK